MTGERLSNEQLAELDGHIEECERLDYPLGELAYRLLADLRAERAETARLRAAAQEVLDFWDDYATTREPGRVALRAALAETEG